MSGEDPYCYPGTSVLRNTLDLRNQQQLDDFERQMFLLRAEEPFPDGGFDLAHLQSLHKHFFQDVYPWAGELRTVALAKGSSHFIPPNKIEMGMADVHRRLRDARFLKGKTPQEFATAAGEVIGDVNYVHPFREGNGRAQLAYLELLGNQAGHQIDLEQLDAREWINASIEAHDARYEAMARCIQQILVG